jgi:hypothetical protein
MKAKVKYGDLRALVKDQLATMREAIDHVSISKVTSSASKLLKAIEDFKDGATPATVNALTPHLAMIERALEDMLSNPGSYVPVQKREPKVVSLRPQKGKKGA